MLQTIIWTNTKIHSVFGSLEALLARQGGSERKKIHTVRKIDNVSCMQVLTCNLCLSEFSPLLTSWQNPVSAICVMASERPKIESKGPSSILALVIGKGPLRQFLNLSYSMTAQCWAKRPRQFKMRSWWMQESLELNKLLIGWRIHSSSSVMKITYQAPYFRKQFPPFNSFRGNYSIYEVKNCHNAETNQQSRHSFDLICI